MTKKKSIKTLENEFKSTALLEQENMNLKKENEALQETVDKLLAQSGNPANSSIITTEIEPEMEIILTYNSLYL